MPITSCQWIPRERVCAILFLLFSRTCSRTCAIPEHYKDSALLLSHRQKRKINIPITLVGARSLVSYHCRIFVYCRLPRALCITFHQIFLEGSIEVHLISIPDYNFNEIVDILLVLGECRGNYRRAAALYHQRFPRRRHHPHDSTMRIIERRERRRIRRRNRQRRDL
ncbi:hypothetical protein X777_04154 [Ooceraea biroi]|uniref:DUF4817 domain-containing protein n=1 Tax=Ooceraea biroi TaxID=2015173 RepID=A0A026WI97_OOCBI|nr:hypothetical protein X777_04154 [Ooceraea biroi]